jgi:hypothetical protein
MVASLNVRQKRKSSGRADVFRFAPKADIGQRRRDGPIPISIRQPVRCVSVTGTFTSVNSRGRSISAEFRDLPDDLRDVLPDVLPDALRRLEQPQLLRAEAAA